MMEPTSILQSDVHPRSLSDYFDMFFDFSGKKKKLDFWRGSNFFHHDSGRYGFSTPSESPSWESFLQTFLCIAGSWYVCAANQNSDVCHQLHYACLFRGLTTAIEAFEWLLDWMRLVRWRVAMSVSCVCDLVSGYTNKTFLYAFTFRYYANKN